ncbi:membrane integrity-associated transporter subunit PqiC [Seongchinamella unica]|uniref:Membrane integrity-associated transporter subunit PqiC n=1 Tax=Seongchinamella unica TaxID=2547392 RepID=A0A4R5LTV0_9GAMM|nr:PqiC family protein [Seongchinamella unica]TDG14806.1 membrane integrity-associated transporter subunit PqiC [Seongchinamella unica]
MITSGPIKLWLALGLLLTLVACGSTPPARHYKLSAQGSLPAASTGPALGVGPVSIPQYLDRDGIIRSDGANGLRIASTERWAEPLDQGITRVLSLNLAGLMETQNIQPFPWHPRRQPDFGVKIRVLAMDADSTQATLLTEWLLYRVSDGQALQQRLEAYSRTFRVADPDAGEIAAAYSELLYQLSGDIADALSPLATAVNRPDSAE